MVCAPDPWRDNTTAGRTNPLLNWTPQRFVHVGKAVHGHFMFFPVTVIHSLSCSWVAVAQGATRGALPRELPAGVSPEL